MKSDEMRGRSKQVFQFQFMQCCLLVYHLKTGSFKKSINLSPLKPSLAYSICDEGIYFSILE